MSKKPAVATGKKPRRTSQPPVKKSLPKGVHYKHGAYYFVDRLKKWHWLDKTNAGAMRAYQALILPPEATGKPRTVGQLLDWYQRTILPEKSTNTQTRARDELKNLRIVFADTHLADLEPSHAMRHITNRTAKVSAEREIALLSHALTQAVGQGWVERNVFIGAPKRAVKKSKARKALDEGASNIGQFEFAVLPGDYQAFVKIAKPVITAALEISALTGLRSVDVLRIRKEWLWEDGLYAVVSKTVHYNSKRKPVEILVPWSPALRRAIATAKAAREGVSSEYLICNRKGNPYTESGFQSMLTRIFKAFPPEANRFHFYDLRRTAGTALTQTSGLELAQAQLTHASARTTGIYSKEVRILPALDTVYGVDNLLDILKKVRRLSN